jgi:hypothetical protein
MFEISIFCVILLAISYWAVLWTMGRREDVLHGEFVEPGAESEEPVRSVFPDRPERTVRPIFPQPPAQTAIAKTTIPEQTAISEQPVRAAMPEQPAFRPERLESLLNSIKQDLNQLVRK